MLDFPANPTVGQVFQGWEWDGVKWISAPSSGGSGGASITVSDTPPPNPTQGALWWESVNGQMYVFYTDANSSQWVPTTNQMGGGYLPAKGVTDGSSAAPGMVGEVLTANGPVTALPTGTWTTVKSMNLTPGDWDVWGTVQITLSGGSVGSQLQASVSLTPASNGGPYPSNGVMTSIVVAGLGGAVLPISAVTFSVAVTTPVYLNAQAIFSSGTSSTTANSFIMARRAR